MLPSAKEVGPSLTLSEHKNSIECCAFSPVKEDILLTGSHDHLMKTWDISKGACISTLEAHDGGVWSVQHSNDGKKILTASPDKTIKLWDASNNSCISTLKGHEKEVYWAKFNKDNTLIASGGADSRLIIWDVKKGSILKQIDTKAAIVYSVDFTDDGKYMMACDSLGNMSIYFTSDFETYQHSEQKARALALSMDFSSESKIPNGIFVAYDDHYSRLYTYNPENNILDFKAEYGPHSDVVKNNVYHGKSNTLVTCCRDGAAKVWDPTNKKLLMNLYGHGESVSSASFSISKQLVLATGSWDQTCNIYKLN